MLDDAYFVEACKNISAGYTPGGSREATYWTGIQIAKRLVEMCKPKVDDLIVDLGSGNGRLAMGLYKLGFLNYTGLEIIPECVWFCQKTFRSVAGYKFFRQPNTNAHYYQGRAEPEDVAYPIATGTADLVAAFSFFSHTGSHKVAERHLKEIKRICKPDSTVFTTWFFNDDEELKESKTVYSKTVIERMFRDTGLLTIDEGTIHGVGGQDQTIWVSTWTT